MTRDIVYQNKRIHIEPCMSCPEGDPLIVRSGDSRKDAIKQMTKGLGANVPRMQGDVSYVCMIYPVGDGERYEAAIHPVPSRQDIFSRRDKKRRSMFGDSHSSL